jgi:phosphoglycerol transferase MdoB-like AlkP superfamily enzyme
MLLRIVFGFIYFSEHHFTLYDLWRIFIGGLRIDAVSFLYVNIIFLLYFIFIVPFLPDKWKITLSVILFAVINLPFIALNFIDLVYFKYTLRRSTIDIFYVVGGTLHAFGALFRQSWHVLLLFIAVAIGFVYVVKKIMKSGVGAKPKWYQQYLTPFFIIAVLVFAAWYRGRLVTPSTAILTNDPVVQPLVNNSTLNILYSCIRSAEWLERKEYFTDSKLDEIYTIQHQYEQDSNFQKRNVVIFILESLSADFFKEGPEKARTPFFDSLLNYSTVCTNAFANGHESVKGLTAILASIPPFTEQPLYISDYSAVPFDGIGTILKNEGYNTNFFHGAEYDHFNFAKLCRMTGIDNYYSKDTYDHSEHDDGNWGIYDEYFFNYFADVMEKKEQPFFSVLFNTSTHPPFATPSIHRDRFKIPGQRAQLNSVTYLDYSFSQLFERIRKQPWFSNTLFVFCADHTLLENTDRRSYVYNAYHIPLFIYDPQDPTKREITRVTQQLDVVPTILSKLHYAKSFMSFGNDFLVPDSLSYGFSIARKNDGYQLIDSAGLLCMDDQVDKPFAHILYQYHYKTDTALKNNFYTDAESHRREEYLKAIIQRFNNSLLDRKLLIRE